MDSTERSPSDPRPFRTPAAGDLLGRLGGTEWDPEHNYESAPARMIREIEEQAAAAGEALAEKMREIYALADAREPLELIEARALAAIEAYDHAREERHGFED